MYLTMHYIMKIESNVSTVQRGITLVLDVVKVKVRFARNKASKIVVVWFFGKRSQ